MRRCSGRASALLQQCTNRRMIPSTAASWFRPRLHAAAAYGLRARQSSKSTSGRRHGSGRRAGHPRATAPPKIPGSMPRWFNGRLCSYESAFGVFNVGSIQQQRRGSRRSTLALANAQETDNRHAAEGCKHSCRSAEQHQPSNGDTALGRAVRGSGRGRGRGAHCGGGAFHSCRPPAGAAGRPH